MNYKRAGKIIFWLGMVISHICLLKGAFAEQEAKNLKPPELSYTATNFRDPFEAAYPKKQVKKEVASNEAASAEESAKNLPDFIVQGLIWGGSMPQAIIDGNVVHIGDTIQEAKVVYIDKEGITVLFYGKEYKIPAPASMASNINKNEGGKQ
jgi:hypothetical protein